MPTPRTRAATTPPADDEGRVIVSSTDNTDPDDEAIEQTAQDRVALMLHDWRSSASAKVKLYRKSPQSKKLQWCADYSVDEFESGGLDMVRRTWGAGDYEIRLYGEREGVFGVLGRNEIEIAAPLETPVAANAVPAGFDQFLQAQSAFNERMLAALTAKKDPVDEMKSMLGMMTMFREAMGLNSAPIASQKSSIAEAVEAVRMLREVSDELNPREKENDPADPMAIVGKIADLVGQAMKNPQAAAQLQQQFPAVALPSGLRLPLIGPTPTPEASTPAAPEVVTQQTEQEMLAQLRAKFAEVIALGVKWRDEKPESDAADELIGQAADIIYEFIPDEFVPALRDGTWFDSLRMIEPSIADHKLFLTAVCAEVIHLFDTPDTSVTP